MKAIRLCRNHPTNKQTGESDIFNGSIFSTADGVVQKRNKRIEHVWGAKVPWAVLGHGDSLAYSIAYQHYKMTTNFCIFFI